MTRWFSPSQISTWLHCNRKWGWRQIDRIDSPPNPAAQEGIQGHAIIERYLKQGKIDLTDPLAERIVVGLHLLPTPSPDLQIEHHFGLRIGSYHFHGYKDVQYIPNHPETVLGFNPIVWDHKFTSNVDRWAKTEDILRTDPQVVLYSLDAMLRSGVPYCDIRWNYFQRRGSRKALPVHFTIHGSDLIEPLIRIVQIAQEITDALSVHSTAKTLTPNVNACHDFGGCIYANHCNLSWFEIWQAMLKSDIAKESFR